MFFVANGSGNDNAKFQSKTGDFITNMRLSHMVTISRQFVQISHGSIVLVTIKTFDELLLTSEELSTEAFILRFSCAYMLGTAVCSTLPSKLCWMSKLYSLMTFHLHLMLTTSYFESYLLRFRLLDGGNVIHLS